MNRELLFIRFPVTGKIVVSKLNGSLYQPIMAFESQDALDFFVTSCGDFLEMLVDLKDGYKFLPVSFQAIDVSDIPSVWLDGWEKE